MMVYIKQNKKIKNMKTKKTITRLVAAATLVAASFTSGFAQQNLGAACGCPPVASRGTPIALSTLADVNGKLTAATTVLNCNASYRIDRKIYVDTLKSLVIQPGTVIYGDPSPGGDPVQACALVVTRGGKIYADGTEECPIVFTATADPMNGTYGVSNRGMWGGVVILGKATTNLTLANATSAFGGTCVGSSCFGTGVGTGYVEGFIAANSENQYGGTDDDDNSGIFRYVSIRHPGAVINTNGNELNGLTLGAVGRNTIIEHVDIISSNDDGIEWFGGTVNVKYITVMFCNDDKFDWDQGYRGKLQFVFGIDGDQPTDPAADNGIEADNDDQKTDATPLSRPVIYNMTIIGNGDLNQNVFDNSAHAAINAKEYTGGEIYNSVFARFETGFNMQQAPGSRVSGHEAYSNWDTTGTLIVKCNSFVGMAPSHGLRLNKSKTSDGIAPSTANWTKFLTTDANDTVPSVAGFDFVYAMNFSTNSVSDKFDAIPNPALATTCNTPADGFFQPAAYKGAFSSIGQNWLSDWSYTQLLNIQSGIAPCPTDINGDGITNNGDFLQLLGQFNQSCQ